MSDAIIGFVGAVVGGVAAIGGAALQARSSARLHIAQAKREESQRRAEHAERLHERQRAFARRYLFQLGEAIDSLLYRLDNWARRGGQGYVRDPGYWEATTLYAVARALGAERVLALEGVYLDLDALWPDRDTGLRPRAVEGAFRDAVGERFFQYDRLALSEAVLERADDGFRLLIYSEFRRRCEDSAWNALLEPARGALTSLELGQVESLERSLRVVKKEVDVIAAAQ